MKLWVAKIFHGSEGLHVIMRSNDNGRSWSKQQKMPPHHLGHGGLFTTGDGQLLMSSIKEYGWRRTILIARSEDNGKTWSDFEPCGQFELPFDHAYPEVSILLKDDSLLWLMFTRTTAGIHFRYYSGAWHGACFSMRSTDHGQTGSVPVNIHGSNPRPDGPMYKLIASEISTAEVADGEILALIRSFWNPTMWKCRSQDGGLTWKPAARGAFAMYACDDAMVSTASGALFIAGRHPGIAGQVSFDRSMTWQCHRIDTPFYANGSAYEVEPTIISTQPPGPRMHSGVA